MFLIFGYREMDTLQQKQNSSLSERSPGPLGLILPPAPVQKDPSRTSVQPPLNTHPAAGNLQAADRTQDRTDLVKSENRTPPASISRPRPSALGSNSSIRSSRNAEQVSKSKSSISPLIPGPITPPTESSLPKKKASSQDLPNPPSTVLLQDSYTSMPIIVPSLSAAFPNPTLQTNTIPPGKGSAYSNPNFQPGLTVPEPSPRPIPQPSISTETLTHLAGGTEKKDSKPSNDSEDFRVHIVTWNVGSAMPPDDITSLFGPNPGSGDVDMFVVGFQEVNCMINKRLKDVLFTDQWSELCMDTLSRSGYVLVASQRMHGVLLLVFSKFCHLPFLRGIQTQSTRTGLGGCWGNKGGVSARMMVFGHAVCFLNCHLPAHMRNLEQRMEDFESILQQQQFEGGTATGVLDHDVVFWFGDLNFRIEDYDIHVVKSAIDSNKLPLLWERDQLNIAKKSERILEGFVESPLNFAPTYKFDVGTNTYDTSAKKRKPAWTDRILWRLRRTGSPVPSHNATLQRGLTSWLGGVTRVTQQSYRSHMGFTVSDHKPVSAVFSLQFPFKIDSPLVTLEVEKEWTKASDASVQFNVTSSYQRSSWDWVGLYRVGFKHHKDYVAYVWAKSEVCQVTFPEEDLPRELGEYILGFYSSNMNSIVAITEPFQLPVCSPPSARSESSDVSSEDDSTLVLLAPSSSRSPSPGTNAGKRQQRHRNRHHSCHRSRSPAVASTPLPSLQSLSLCPRPRDAHVQSPSPCTARSTHTSGVAKKERLVWQESTPSPTSSLSPLSPRSPVSPGSGVSAPEALIVAILGEHRPIPPAAGTTGAKATGTAAESGHCCP
ncbi:phosphatidylinositol 4,5-bisphosphate 5-phosphatase A isoform X2 [Denticeps clupeoides]|uniref:phosphatidylinositol 4,5-bisphosphate 5-phosphatase A isoform X2 n=1 Tax=Denticeps clupeoides TaxID=299321 RepID=UPI0010A2C315|nr:phosphatidylinositol 4,5-bisphosphate 5-phosphatase A isoform X2 [Denticeps clupeoides]